MRKKTASSADSDIRFPIT